MVHILLVVFESCVHLRTYIAVQILAVGLRVVSTYEIAKLVEPRHDCVYMGRMPPWTIRQISLCKEHFSSVMFRAYLVCTCIIIILLFLIVLYGYNNQNI